MLFSIAFESIHRITSDNATDLMSDEPHIPILACIVRQFCPHCAEFAPIWAEVEKKFVDDKRFLMATISVDTDLDTCKLFDYGGATPSIYWVRTTPKDAEPYDGAYTVESFQKFIEKHLDSTVIEVKDQDEYEKYIEKYSDQSIFVLHDLNSDYIQIFTDLAHQYDSYPAIFIYAPLQTNNEINAYIQYLFPDGQYSVKHTDMNSISSFVKEHIFPQVTIASPKWFEIVNKANKKFVLIHDNHNRYLKNITAMTQRLPRDLMIGNVDCKDQPRVCRAFGLKRKGSQISVVNKAKNIYYNYNSTMTDDAVENFINRALNGRWAERGPGATKGILGDIKNWFLMQEVKTLAVVGACILLGTIFLIGWSCK